MFQELFSLCPKLVGKSSCYPVQNHVWFFVVEWDLCDGGLSIPFLRFHIIIYALNTKFLEKLFDSSCCIDLITPPILHIGVFSEHFQILLFSKFERNARDLQL